MQDTKMLYPCIPLSGSLQGGRGILVAQTVNNPPAVQEIWVRFLGQEDPLEKDIPLQFSCLENSMNRGVCQATVHGVANNWTRLSD